jgi:hypothetical protein
VRVPLPQVKPMPAATEPAENSMRASQGSPSFTVLCAKTGALDKRNKPTTSKQIALNLLESFISKPTFPASKAKYYEPLYRTPELFDCIEICIRIIFKFKHQSAYFKQTLWFVVSASALLA